MFFFFFFWNFNLGQYLAKFLPGRFRELPPRLGLVGLRGGLTTFSGGKTDRRLAGLAASDPLGDSKAPRKLSEALSKCSVSKGSVSAELRMLWVQVFELPRRDSRRRQRQPDLAHAPPLPLQP